jgi:hypothetical protein
VDANTLQQKLDLGRARFRTWQLPRVRSNIVSLPESERGYDVQTSPQGWQSQDPQDLFATPTAKQSAGYPLACTISTNSVTTDPVDLVRGTTHTMVGKPMALMTSHVQTLETVFTPGGTCSTPHVQTDYPKWVDTNDWRACVDFLHDQSVWVDPPPTLCFDPTPYWSFLQPSPF